MKETKKERIELFKKAVIGCYAGAIMSGSTVEFFVINSTVFFIINNYEHGLVAGAPRRPESKFSTHDYIDKYGEISSVHGSQPKSRREAIKLFRLAAKKTQKLPTKYWWKDKF